jgi:hypothetical protein
MQQSSFKLQNADKLPATASDSVTVVDAAPEGPLFRRTVAEKA